MIPGWHHLDDSDPSPALGSATFLDAAGVTKGLQSRLKLCRIYFKGKPSPQELAHKARYWALLDCRIQLGNELNHPCEEWPGSAADYRVYFAEVKALAPEALLYWQPPSPGFAGWESWYDGAEVADGIAVHAYGEMGHMVGVVSQVLERFPEKRLWISEVNFGPGPDRAVNRDVWARDHFKPFLDWCSQWPQIEAVSYFAYRWPNPDMAMATPVDGAGTGIETVLREWQEEEQSGGTMLLQEQFPDIYREWVNAGGIENNFRDHVLALGALPATKDDLRGLVDQLRAKADQVVKVANALPLV